MKYLLIAFALFIAGNSIAQTKIDIVCATEAELAQHPITTPIEVGACIDYMLIADYVDAPPVDVDYLVWSIRSRGYACDSISEVGSMAVGNKIEVYVECDEFLWGYLTEVIAGNLHITPKEYIRGWD